MPLTRQRQLFAKSEATYATDPVIVAADALLVHDLTGPALQQVQSGRAQHTPSLSALRSARVGRRHWTLGFWTPLRGTDLALGSPTPVPLADPLMRACGMSATWDAVGPPTNNWTYQPERAGFESVCLEVEESEEIVTSDAVFTQLLGCRGNMKIVGSVGEIVRQEFEFMGLYNGAPANRGAGNALLGTLADDVDPLVMVSTGFTPNFGGGADAPDVATFGHIRAFSIDMRNKIVPSVSGSIATGDGIRSFEKVGRGEADDAGPMITLEVEFPALVGGVADYAGRYHGRTLTSAEATITLGTEGGPSTPAGNTVRIGMARISVDDWQWADFDGIVGMNVEGRLLNSGQAATTDDEFYIRFS